MKVRVTLAVAGRVLTQVRRDHRTLAMLLVLPCVLITLLWWMFADIPGDLFDRFGPALLAMFPFIVMFLVTSVTTLRERSSGTLERLLVMPMGKLDFLLADAVLGSALGLFVSAFARTEFQAVQFLPLIVFPQILLCGLFVPRESLPT